MEPMIATWELSIVLTYPNVSAKQRPKACAGLDILHVLSFWFLSTGTSALKEVGPLKNDLGNHKADARLCELSHPSARA